MDSLGLLRSGDPSAALETLKQEVRRAPRNVRLRTFLFQLFCVFGEWDRALTQLTVVGELDPLAMPMVQAYGAAIRCEMLRARVFAGERTPTVFGDPEPWMSMLIEANRGLAGGAHEQAASLRDEAFEQAPATAGTIVAQAPADTGPDDGTAFDWIADADPRLGPMLEALVDGRYLWVPLHRIGAVEIDAPEDLRDQVWMPVRFTWANGGESAGFIPTRYPAPQGAADPALAMARRTEWVGDGAWFTGRGQRMLVTDGGEYALQDVRRIVLHPATQAA